MDNFNFLCDAMMEGYEQTAQRDAEQTKIAESIKLFRRKLDAKTAREFNSLLDSVNNSDTDALYEAFMRGCCFAAWIFSTIK